MRYPGNARAGKGMEGKGSWKGSWKGNWKESWKGRETEREGKLEGKLEGKGSWKGKEGGGGVTQKNPTPTLGKVRLG